jgi:transcriptional regulator with XRE-family HTH domain
MTISYKDLAEKAGISLSYATQLLSDDPAQKRTPSLDMALKIYDATGLQLGLLEGLSRATIRHLRPKSQQAA